MKKTYEYLSVYCDDEVESDARNSSGGYGTFFDERKIFHNNEEIALITFYKESWVSDIDSIVTLDDFFKYYTENKNSSEVSFLIMCDWLEP